MLAVMAACALGNGSAGCLHLNEIAATRAGLLSGLFPGAPVTRHNAESLRDRLPALRPTVVLMNPPFSASPGVDRTRKDADLRHIHSAFSMLPPGGRLVTISSAHCAPGDTAWKDAFASLDLAARVVFSAIIDGRVYARRGTTFDTRLTVLDRGGDEQGPIDPPTRVSDAAQLLEAAAAVPARLPIEPVQAVPSPASDLFDHATAPRRAPRKSAGATPSTPQPHDWGPVAELEYEAGPATFDPTNDAHASGPYEPWRAGTICFPRCGRASHAAGAVRRHGGGAAPGALVPSHAAHADRDRGAPVRCPARERRPRRPGTRTSPRRPLPHRRRMGRPSTASTARAMTQMTTAARAMPVPTAGDDNAGDNEPLSAPVRFRRGWMLGDGTGCGKGRQVAAIILDQLLRGRKRALWLSQSDKLLEDTRRDWSAIGGRGEDVIPLAKVRQGADIPQTQGILFATYATLRSPARQGKQSRLDQIVAWLAGGENEDDRHAFSGVIVFDEAHAMANAAGSKGPRGDAGPSQQGRAGLWPAPD